ncbi:MAG: hypothetical protein M1825_005609 [Sarcosagium campestre]|nr:MAG: hypothetical protein M1825_005609 [Sarcosagium campestre]
MASASTLAAGPPTGPLLSARDMQEVLEYDKIIRLRDEIFAGTHPRLKIPSHLIGKLSQRTIQSPALLAPRLPAGESKPRAEYTPTRPSQDDSRAQSQTTHPVPLANPSTAQSKTFPKVASSSSIDPVLLTKSDDLVRAELRISRDRLERALREQCEQKRLDHAPGPDFNVGEVLEKAQARVKPVTVTNPAPSRPTSDSFDEKSFYSSQQNGSLADEMEESNVVPPAATTSGSQPQSAEADDSDLLDDPYSPTSDTGAINLFNGGDAETAVPALQDAAPKPPSRASERRRSASAFQHFQSHGGQENLTRADAERASELAYTAEPSRRYGTRQDQATLPNFPYEIKADGRREQQQNAKRPLPVSPPSPRVPVIRNQIRSPIAPQPARVSPLAVARMPAVPQVIHAVDEVSGGHSNHHSPEGPQNALAPRKKRRVQKPAEKSRKALRSRRAAESPEPHIKEEPLSPPPLSAFETPGDYHSRQQPDPDATLGPSRGGGGGPYRQTIVIDNDVPVTTYRRERYERDMPRTGGGGLVSFPRETLVRPLRAPDGIDRYGDVQRVDPLASPAYYSIRGSSPDVRHYRAPSRSVVHEPAPGQARYRYEEIRPVPSHYVRRERSRSPPPSAVYRERPASPGQISSAMAPPRVPHPRRIAVDADGRRYISAPATALTRHSIAPSGRQSVDPGSKYEDPGPVYERLPAPPRVSDWRYDDEAYIERALPSRASSRALVEQAPVAPDGYRIYRERDYPPRPAEYVLPRQEYAHSRILPERRAASHFEDIAPPREYVTSMPSVRPRDVRYEQLPAYEHRMQSVQPDIGRGDITAAHRVEAPPRSLRDVSIRVDEGRREIGPRLEESSHQYASAVRERDAYAMPPPSDGRRYMNEIRYVEQPREMVHEDVNGHRRASYRY